MVPFSQHMLTLNLIGGCSLLQIIDVERGIDELKAVDILDNAMNSKKTCKYFFTVCCSGFVALDLMRCSRFELLIVQDTDSELCGDTLMRIVRNLGYTMPAVLLCSKDGACTMLPPSVREELKREHGSTLESASSESIITANSGDDNYTDSKCSSTNEVSENKLHEVLTSFVQKRGYASVLLYPFKPIALDAAVETAMLYSATDAAKEAMAPFYEAPRPPPRQGATGTAKTGNDTLCGKPAGAGNGSNVSANETVSAANSKLMENYKNRMIKAEEALSTQQAANAKLVQQCNTLSKSYTKVILDFKKKYDELNAKLNIGKSSSALLNDIIAKTIPSSSSTDGGTNSLSNNETILKNIFAELPSSIESTAKHEVPNEISASDAAPSIDASDVALSKQSLNIDEKKMYDKIISTYCDGILDQETVLRVIVAQELLKYKYDPVYREMRDIIVN